MKFNPEEFVEFGHPDGPLLISVARESINRYFKTKTVVIPPSITEDPRFRRRMGCFVTLKKNDEDKSLRGCIGFPYSTKELSRVLPESAVAAAFDDPRFPPIREIELRELLLEISLLTEPSQIEAKDQRELPKKIEVGKDGLIMKWSFGSGLLLPQVATEYNWDSEEFLCNLSMKAGAPPDQWLVPGTIVYKFNALVFQEESPLGQVTLMTR